MSFENIIENAEKYIDKRTRTKTFLINVGPDENLRIPIFGNLQKAYEEIRTNQAPINIMLQNSEHNGFFQSVKVPSAKEMRSLGGFATHPLMLNIWFKETSTLRCLFTKGKEKIIPINENARNISKDEDASFRIDIASGISRVAKKTFHCSFHLGQSPLAFFLDPETIIKIFKDRQPPPDGSRKKALLHIVNGHNRRLPEKDEFIEIQSYLRGERSCIYGGMKVDLYGPDIRDYQKYINDIAELEEKEKNINYFFNGNILN